MKYKFKCPMYGVEVTLVVGLRKQLKNIVGDSGDNEHDAECHTIYDDKSVVIGFLIWIEKPTDYNAMVHETLHLIKRIFECIGIPFNSDNDEIMAYYQNYWIRLFWNKMSKGLDYMDDKTAKGLIEKNKQLMEDNYELEKKVKRLEKNEAIYHKRLLKATNKTDQHQLI